MTVRFKAGDIRGIPSGYERPEAPTDLTIPSCGIADVDAALFNVLDKEINFEVGNDEKVVKVPTIFASGEKWAMIKNYRKLRDKNDTIILPVITVNRTGVNQDVSEDICGRGINQQTGEIVIKRRLSELDREYQSIINKLYIKNQLNVSAKVGEGLLGQIETIQDIGELSNSPEVINGGLMVPNRNNNIWEVISIPSPQFFTVTYDVIFWTQYTIHMNQLIEKLLASLLTPGNCLKLETPAGYWFLAYFPNLQFSPETNFSEQSGQERVIKYKFSLKVPAYTIATKVPGAPVPIRRTISCPSINFSIGGDVGEIESGPGEENVLLIGADDPTLPTSIKSTGHSDQRMYPSDKFMRTDLVDNGDPAKAVDSKGRPLKKQVKFINKKFYDPKTGKTIITKVRALSSNKQGEQVFSALDIDLQTNF